LSITLARLAREFLDRPGLSQNTRKSYEFTLIPLLKEHGWLSVEIITRQTMCDYLNALTHIHHTTHHRHQAIIQALFNFAVEQGYLSNNPLSGLKRRKPDADKGEHGTDEIIRYLSAEQLTILYKLVATDFRMNALVRLLHRTGARISEILALDLDTIDLNAKKFQVIGKGNKRRWCFYSDDASIAMQKYFQYERHPHSKAVFTAKQPLTGEITRLSYRRFHKCWSDLIAQTPILLGVRIHDLRHTFATERVGLMGIETLRALMGHENIQTTLRYQKVTSSRAEEIAQLAFNTLVKY
jgi:integrase/recombinase XerD